MLSPWALVLPWLLLRLVPGVPGPVRDRWHTAVDLPLLLGAGLLSGGLCGLWLAAFHLADAAVVGSPDFLEYCWSTDALASRRPGDFSRNRGVLAALPSALIARQWGVLNGLLGSAMLSVALLGTAVALWARAAHSRAAGLVAALAVGAVVPLCLLARTLTYYPPVIAVLTLCMATAAAALRWRTAAACLVAGTGAGLALLVDVRGLPWALAALGIAGVAAVLGASRRWRATAAVLRLGALALPVWLSFQLGPVAYLEGTRTLEDAMHTPLDLQKMGFPVQRTVPMPRRDEGFLWGRSELARIPETLRFVHADGQLIPDELRSALHVVDHRQRRVDPWLPVGLGALVAAVLGGRRRPLALLGAAGAAVPFVLALDSAVVVKQSHPRFLANALPFLPVLLGVGAASLGGLDRGGWRARAGAVLALLVVLGALPSWLSPVAPWRSVPETTARAVERSRAVAAGQLTPKNAAEQSCATAVSRVAGDGSWLDQLP
jgi:hypothetical protein